MTEIRGNGTRKVVRAVTIVEVYRRFYPNNEKTSSCSRTLVYWKQSLEPQSTDLALRRLAPRDGFEPPAKRLTVACSTAELPGKSLCSVIQHKIHHATPFFASIVPISYKAVPNSHVCFSSRSASRVIASRSSASASITAMSL